MEKSKTYLKYLPRYNRPWLWWTFRKLNHISRLTFRQSLLANALSKTTMFSVSSAISTTDQLMSVT